MPTSSENTVSIANTVYAVHQLSEAQRQTYWEFIDGLAEEKLNPWNELYQKVKDLPLRLQEIVFVGSRKRLFPLTRQEKTGMCCSVDAIMRLLEVSLDVLHGLCLNSPQDTKDIATEIVGNLNRLSRPELLQVYIDVIDILGDSYTGTETPAEPERHYSHQAAIDHLRGVMNDEEKQESQTDGK